MKNGWGYINCTEDDSTYGYTLYLYTKIIDEKTCVAQLWIDSMDYLRGWYVDNWLWDSLASTEN